jgi:hypothetical protein
MLRNTITNRSGRTDFELLISLFPLDGGGL